MFRPLQFALRARLLPALMTILAAAFPGPAKAIQLRWGSGGTDLNAMTNIRAMLVIASDSSEGTLPPTWRLQWTADSSTVGFTQSDGASSGSGVYFVRLRTLSAQAVVKIVLVR